MEWTGAEKIYSRSLCPQKIYNCIKLQDFINKIQEDSIINVNMPIAIYESKNVISDKETFTLLEYKKIFSGTLENSNILSLNTVKLLKDNYNIINNI
jgi:hypothetical protein